MNGHKFCGHCGSEIKTDAKFCGSCGSEVTPAVAPAPAMPTAPITQPVQPVAQAEPKKKTKKLLILCASIVSVLAIAGGITFAIIANLPKTRTVMIYMIGSNLESEYASGSADIQEMIDSKFDPEYTKVLVYTGGSKQWEMDGISASENAIFEVSADGITKVQTYDRKVMSKKEVLTEYIDFAYENYKSSYYDLVLWNHGGGPIVGYGHDEFSISNSLMSLKDLESALAESTLIKDQKKFDFIGFDACLMGSVEVGNTLKNYADYLIASEESEPGMGWNYDFLNTIEAKTETKDLAKNIIDQFIAHYDDYPYKVGLSLSVIDLSKIDKVTEAANGLFNKVDDELNAKNFSEYSRELTRERVYGYDGRDSQSFDLVDLQDLASGVEKKYPTEYSTLKDAIAEAVVYGQTNMSDTNGLSVYFPTNNKKNAKTLVARYKDVAYSSDYYKFLSKYIDLINGKRVVSRSTYGDLEEKQEGKGVSVELPDELAENYQKAEVIVYRKLGENKFAPIYRGSNVTLEGNTLKTDNANLQFVVKTKEADGTEDSGWIALLEKERNSEYAEYVSFGVLYYDDGSRNGSAPKSYEMHLRVKTGEKKAEVTDIRVQSTEDGVSGKVSFDPAKIQGLDMIVSTYKLFDENGKRLEKLESWGQMYGTSLNLKKGDTYEILLEDLDYDFGDMYAGEIDQASLSDYYAEFVVYDTQGDSHRLNIIHINK